MPKKNSVTPMLDLDECERQLRRLLCEQVERLYELELDMMRSDIAAGWRCFYAEEIWLEKHLPAPLINDAGKAANLENLRRIVLEGKYAKRVEPEPEGYRNYLAIGQPDIYAGEYAEGRPLDLVANAVITRLLETEHRNMRFEVKRDREQWYAEASEAGTLTPPLIYTEPEPNPPVRNDQFPLARDSQYWYAMYPSQNPVFDAQHYHAQVKPDYVVRLMEQVAPDYAYDAERGTSKSLFFVGTDERALQWAVLLEKTSGSTNYRYPPQLLLICRSKKKVRPEDVIYVHNELRQPPHASTLNPRDIEMQLKFHMSRIRKQIAFLDPFVNAALAAAKSAPAD